MNQNIHNTVASLSFAGGTLLYKRMYFDHRGENGWRIYQDPAVCGCSFYWIRGEVSNIILNTPGVEVMKAARLVVSTFVDVILCDFGGAIDHKFPWWYDDGDWIIWQQLTSWANLFILFINTHAFIIRAHVYLMVRTQIFTIWYKINKQTK